MPPGDKVASVQDTCGHLDEIVASVPVEHYSSLVNFQGVRHLPQSTWGVLLDRDKIVMGAQRKLDRDANYKQIISYAIVRAGARFLCLRRAGGGNVHSILRGKLSIGVGGHLSQEDLSIGDAVLESVWFSVLREIREETGLTVAGRHFNLSSVALLNDDSLYLCRTHFGIVFNIQLGRDVAASPLVPEHSEISDLQWVALHQLRRRKGELELWSRIALGSVVA